MSLLNLKMPIQPALDIATSLSLFLTCIIYMLTTYYERRKERKISAGEKMKDRRNKIRESIQSALQNVKLRMDKIQERSMVVAEQLSSKCHNIQNADPIAKRLLSAKLDEILDFYLYALNLAPQEIYREFQIAFYNMPEKDIATAINKLKCEKLVLEMNIEKTIELSRQMINGYRKLFLENKPPKNIDNNEAVASIINYLNRRNRTADNESLFMPLLQLDQFYDTMANYCIHISEYTKEHEGRYIGLFKFLPKEHIKCASDPKSMISLIRVYLSEKNLIDYDIELLFGIINNNNIDIMNSLRCGACIDMIVKEIDGKTTNKRKKCIEDLLIGKIDSWINNKSEVSGNNIINECIQLVQLTQSLQLTDEKIIKNTPYY